MMLWLSWRMTASTLSSGWCLRMSNLIRLRDNQLKRVKELIHNRCCNFSDGNCLMLDWPYCSICPQEISHSLCCSWFRNSVLPNDPLLEAQLLGKKLKRCVACSKIFVPRSNRAEYCPYCSLLRRRETKRIWAQRKKYGF